MPWLEWFLEESMLIQMTIEGLKENKNNQDNQKDKMIMRLSVGKESG